MKNKDALAVALFVLGVLFVALVVNAAVTISFGSALLLGVAAVVSVVIGSTINDYLNDRAAKRRVDRDAVV